MFIDKQKRPLKQKEIKTLQRRVNFSLAQLLSSLESILFSNLFRNIFGFSQRGQSKLLLNAFVFFHTIWSTTK